MNKTKIFGGILAVSLGAVALIGCQGGGNTPVVNSYVVKFTNGNKVISTKYYDEGATIEAPANPKDYVDEKEHTKYTFDAWYDGNVKFETGTKATKNVTYDAAFIGKKFTCSVSFFDEHSMEEPVVRTGEWGSLVELPDTPEDYEEDHIDYEFVNWVNDETGEEIADDYKFEGDASFTAKYDANPIKYKVEFYDEDETTKLAEKFISTRKLTISTPEAPDPQLAYDYFYVCSDPDLIGVYPPAGERFTFDKDDLPADRDTVYKFYLDKELSTIVVNFWPGEVGVGEPVATHSVHVNDQVSAPAIDHETYETAIWVNAADPTDTWDPAEGPYTFLEEDFVDTELNYIIQKEEIVNDVTFSNGTQTTHEYFSHSNLTITAPECDEPTPGYSKNVWYDATNNITIESEGTHKFNDADVTKTFAFVQTGVGNKYTVTYNANGGTVDTPTSEVTFGKEYELKTPTNTLNDMKFAGWYNEDTLVPTTGIWSIPNNVTLKAHWVISFDSYTTGATSVDSFDSPLNCTIAVAEDEASNGEKVLKITPTGFDYGIKIKKGYLDAMFADSNVTGITFMAKSDVIQSNFRYHTNPGTGFTNICYERNYEKYGLRPYWKTFTYTRTAYNTFSADDYMIYGGNTPAPAPSWVEIKRIQVTTNPLTEWDSTARGTGFEGGWLRSLDEAQPLYYNAGNGNSTDGNALKALEFGALNSHTPFIENTIVKSGNASLGFTRAAASTDWMSLCVFNAGNGSYDYTVSFDFYSEIRLNSYGSTQNISDGTDHAFGDGDWHVEPNTWTHFDLTTSQMSLPSSTGSPKGRSVFMKIKGSSSFPQFKFYIDNIVFHPVA